MVPGEEQSNGEANSTLAGRDTNWPLVERTVTGTFESQKNVLLSLFLNHSVIEGYGARKLYGSPLLQRSRESPGGFLVRCLIPDSRLRGASFKVPSCRLRVAISQA